MLVRPTAVTRRCGRLWIMGLHKNFELEARVTVIVTTGFSGIELAFGVSAGGR